MREKVRKSFSTFACMLPVAGPRTSNTLNCGAAFGDLATAVGAKVTKSFQKLITLTPMAIAYQKEQQGIRSLLPKPTRSVITTLDEIRSSYALLVLPKFSEMFKGLSSRGLLFIEQETDESYHL